MKQIALFACLLLVSCSTIMPQQAEQKPTSPIEPKVCDVIRGVFEFGSSIVRLKVAKMDRCENKMTTVLLDRTEQVGFQEDLLHSRTQSFSEKFMKEAEEKIKQMKEDAAPLMATEYVAIATESFREAKNGKPFIEKISLELQFDAQILAQQEEAALAFFAASQTLQTPVETTLIWDIGGASQQMIHYKGNNKFATYDGKLGTVTFKDYILKRILKKGAFSEPLNNYQTKLAVDYAKDTAQRTVKHDVRDFFLMPNTNIIGIGGTLANGIRNQIDPSGKNDFFTKDDVEKSLQGHDLNGDVAARLALVLGYMKALRIEKVRVADVNMTDGLFMDYKYWKP